MHRTPPTTSNQLPMMPTSVFFLLRFVHIVVGVTWGGAVIFIAAFLLPALKSVGPAGGPVMNNLTQVRRLPAYLMAGVILTVLSGIALYWNDSLGFSAQWMATGPGKTFAFGGTLAIIVAILGMTINAPTAKRMAALTATIQATGSPPSAEQVAEIHRLQARLLMALRTAAILVVIAAAAMSVARYVPT
jgi:uncharacterized membrane protein